MDGSGLFCCGFIDGCMRALAADVDRLLTPLAVDEAADE